MNLRLNLRFKMGLVAGCLLLVTASVSAYEGKQHQRLTFLAAKHFNSCVTGTDIPMLSALQVRYMARANVGLAEPNIFVRMFRWDYYDREDESERSMMWMFDTRFHEHFNEILARVEKSDDPIKAYQELGRVLGYIQVVTSPAHAVPVYTARFWRLSFSDRFDSYGVDERAVLAALGDDCSFLQESAEDYGLILSAAASDTLQAISQPIAGMPTTWEAFWSLSEKAGDFGDYGAAGNSFGRKTQFRCGENRQRCMLLNDDPLYSDFALARHMQAVRGTLAAMQLMQLRTIPMVAAASAVQ